MRKMKLDIETLDVQSFETTAVEKAARGTVLGHEPTMGHNVQCGSAYDACHTGLCTYDRCPPTYGAECATQTCETDPSICVSGGGRRKIGDRGRPSADSGPRFIRPRHTPPAPPRARPAIRRARVRSPPRRRREAEPEDAAKGPGVKVPAGLRRDLSHHSTWRHPRCARSS